MSDNPFRLPRGVVPNHYDIRLEPDLETGEFTGSVGADIEVLEAASSITLNTADIVIESATLSSSGAARDISYDEKRERATLTFDPAPQPGSHRLNIKHRGVINDKLRGWYRSTHRDAGGGEHAIAASQCQATDARRIFPCWDEPDFKATFRTTLVVDPELEGYSNTSEVERATLDDGRIEIRFAPTMKMSTYLLAFIVGPFEATEPTEVRGTPIRVIVPRGNLHLTATAMENAVFCFEYLSDYYGIGYPGDKLDHIAVPDFAAGAMENMGLITYRDSYLIVDREKASQAELQNCLDVIGHEIAHQWFGNLVTMAWWEGAWLNEAFASFMEFKATEAMRPEWKRWLSFSNDWKPWAMSTDQLVNTRPIEFEVNSPEEVDQMFDSITYGKGAAVLRMMEMFIGEESFRRGVTDYLSKHKHANTVTADLWEGLDGASEWPVSDIMSTWVYQRGFPQIDARLVDGGARLSQRRHLAIPDEPDSTIWKAPVQIRGESHGKPFEVKILVEGDEAFVPIRGDLDWMTANAGGHGFYRSRYSEELLEDLIDNIERLNEIERHTLVSDTLAFVQNGQVSADRFLDLAAELGAETEQAIWSVVSSGLGLLEHHALDEEARPAFEGFVRKLTRPALTRLGWEPEESENDLTRKLRGALITTMGALGADNDTIARATDAVERLLSGAELDPEVATAALAVYARRGGADEHALLWEAYLKSGAPLDQVRYLRSVAGVGATRPALSTLDKVIDGDIRSQDGYWVFARLLMGKAGPAVWESARRRWDQVLEAMPGITRIRVAEGLSALSQPEVANDVKAFFAEHPIPEAARPLAQNLEKLDVNVALRERETPVVTDYFSD